MSARPGREWAQLGENRGTRTGACTDISPTSLHNRKEQVLWCSRLLRSAFAGAGTSIPRACTRGRGHNRADCCISTAPPTRPRGGWPPSRSRTCRRCCGAIAIDAGVRVAARSERRLVARPARARGSLRVSVPFTKALAASRPLLNWWLGHGSYIFREPQQRRSGGAVLLQRGNPATCRASLGGGSTPSHRSSVGASCGNTGGSHRPRYCRR